MEPCSHRQSWMPAGRRSAQQTPCQVSTQRMTPSALAIKLHFSQHLRRIVCIQCSQLPLLCCQRSARLVLQSVWLKCPCVRAHSMAYSIVSVLVCVVRSRQDTLYAITILLRWGACVVPVVGFVTRWIGLSRNETVSYSLAHTGRHSDLMQVSGG